MDDDLKQNLTAAETWIRGFFILLFIFALLIARVVTGAVVVIQFLFTVFSGQSNDNLRYFGASLALFVYQALLFVTYNSDDKPFPFAPWPAPGDSNQPVARAVMSNDVDTDDSGANNGDAQEADEHEPRS